MDRAQTPGTEIHTPIQVVETKPIDPLPPVEIKEVPTIHPVPDPKPVQPTAPATSTGWHRAPCGVGANNKREQIKQAATDLGLGADLFYIDFIFGKESTWDPGCENHIGCRGIGQACPGSKLPCGPDDVTCQVQWFHNYAMRAHGGTWASNYAFWLNNHWW